MKKIVKVAGLLLASAAFSNYALAEKNTDFASGLYIAPGINVMDIKDKFDGAGPSIKRKAGANLSVGYEFDSPWAIEFMYQYAKPEVRNTKKDFKMNYAHLDGLYTFDWFEGSGWAPYVVAGLGRMSYNVRDTNGFKESDHTLNAGAGIKYAFTKNFLVTRIIKPHVDIHVLEETETNFKSRLIEWCQQAGKGVAFVPVDSQEDARSKIFTVDVVIDGEVFGTGRDYNKKSAEKLAAEKACETLNVL